MPDGSTARARMERILYLLAAASREGGVDLEDAAGTLDTTPEALIRDLQEVTDRAFYHPGGWPDDVRIAITPRRVEVLGSPGLHRPLKLTRREALCLALGLRATAARSALPDVELRRRLLDRAEAMLVQEGAWMDEPVPAPPEGALALSDTRDDPEGIRETLLAAAAARRACVIHYRKPDDPEGSVRGIHPYVLSAAEGRWYVVGRCLLEDDVRVFRVDRVLAADVTGETFEVGEDFDPHAFVRDGRVYRAHEEREVPVRYSRRIARWIREGAHRRGLPLQEGPDGSVVVRHRVADPHWVIRHALQYGAEAEILGPEDVRDLMRQILARITGEAEAA